MCDDKLSRIASRIEANAVAVAGFMADFAEVGLPQGLRRGAHATLVRVDRELRSLLSDLGLAGRSNDHDDPVS